MRTLLSNCRLVLRNSIRLGRQGASRRNASIMHHLTHGAWRIRALAEELTIADVAHKAAWRGQRNAGQAELPPEPNTQSSWAATDWRLQCQSRITARLQAHLHDTASCPQRSRAYRSAAAFLGHRQPRTVRHQHALDSTTGRPLRSPNIGTGSFLCLVRLRPRESHTPDL